MKNLTTILLVIILFGCNQYRSVTRPLRYVPADCHCRYEQIAKHLFWCKKWEFINAGLPVKVAIDSATVITNRKIAETQLKVHHGANLRCDCLIIKQRRMQ